MTVIVQYTTDNGRHYRKIIDTLHRKHKWAQYIIVIGTVGSKR